MQKLSVILAATLAMVAGVASAHHLSEESVKERTKPTGQVYHVGDDVPVAKAAVVESSGPRDGEAVFSTKCAACHATGAAGAPKLGDKDAWAARIAQGEDTLLQHALNGFNAMPPRGTCGDCSDDEILEAIRHMVGKSQ